MLPRRVSRLPGAKFAVQNLTPDRTLPDRGVQSLLDAKFAVLKVNVTDES